VGLESSGQALAEPTIDQLPLTLRFRDPAVEREFQVESGRRFRRQVVLTILLGAATWAVTGILLIAIFPTDPISIAASIAIVEVMILGIFAVSPRVRLWDQLQTLSALVNLIGGVAIIAIGGYVAHVPHLVTAALLVNLLFAFGLSRFGTIGVIYSSIYVALFAVVVLSGTLPAVGIFEVFLVGIGFAVATIAGYLLEANSRRMFVQRRLITSQARALEAEKEKSERLIHNMLPDHIADRLRESSSSVADRISIVSVLFGDLVGFTPLASRLAPDELVAVLDELFSRFDELATRHGLEKIKTIGDAYMAVAGTITIREDDATRTVAMGLDMLTEVERFKHEVDLPLALRVGVHTGPVVAGVIGRVRISYDLWGDTVNVASRMESHGVPGAVQISEETAHAIAGAFPLEPVGVIEVRGKGPMPTFLVRPPTGPASA
jgi:adenylate cyclase